MKFCEVKKLDRGKLFSLIKDSKGVMMRLRLLNEPSLDKSLMKKNRKAVARAMTQLNKMNTLEVIKNV